MSECEDGWDKWMSECEDGWDEWMSRVIRWIG